MKLNSLIFFISIAISQVDYQTEIEPIFYDKCSGCHTSGGSSGGLDLTSYSTLMAGGNSGASILPGDHQNSLLWKRINDGSMPPSSNNVSPSKVELVKKWINEGALANPPSANNPPETFNWLSAEKDTIKISSSNLSSKYLLAWTESKDPDGDKINYILYAKIGNNPYEAVDDTSAQKIELFYQDFLDNVFENSTSETEIVQFTIDATDNKDTVRISGNDRIVYVDRTDYLSIDEQVYPKSYALYANFPNPFNPITQIRFDLPVMTNADLVIYNMLGQKVKTFNIPNASAGNHLITWNATNELGTPVSAGVYLYQLQTEGFVKTKKMILLK